MPPIDCLLPLILLGAAPPPPGANGDGRLHRAVRLNISHTNCIGFRSSISSVTIRSCLALRSTPLARRLVLSITSISSPGCLLPPAWRRCPAARLLGDVDAGGSAACRAAIEVPAAPADEYEFRYTSTWSVHRHLL